MKKNNTQQPMPENKLGSQEFFDLMQQYRIADPGNQELVINCYNRVKEFLSAPTQPTAQEPGASLTDRLLDNPMQEEEDYKDFIDAAYPSRPAQEQGKELDWKYSPHFKDDAQGHIFSYGKDRMVFNVTGAAATSQKQLNKDCEEMCKRYNEYPRLYRENKELKDAIKEVLEHNCIIHKVWSGDGSDKIKAEASVEKLKTLLK